MGFSTTITNKPQNDLIAEFTATSDFSLKNKLGKKIKVNSIWRKYPVIWEASDNGKLFAHFNGMFCEFEL